MNTIKIVTTNYLVKYKLEKFQFFQNIFSVTKISLKIVLKIIFLTFSKINIYFLEWKLDLKIYIAIKDLLITQKVEVIKKNRIYIKIINYE